VNDRRQQRRYAVSWTAEVAGAAESPFVVEVVNISHGGLGLVGVKTMNIGDTFFFKITGWTGAPLKGIVRWTEGSGGPTYSGIEFLEMTDAERKILGTLVGRFDTEDWGSTSPRADGPDPPASAG
jgi:hypothetical protein